jgi:hypothetical protein
MAASATVLITDEPQAGETRLPGAEEEASALANIFGDVGERCSRISADQLADSLRSKRVWFFCGHGDALLQGEKVLAFEKNGEVDAISISSIIRIVKSVPPKPPELIVLTGCLTAKLGEAMSEAGIQHICCWSTHVCDHAAKVFAESFGKTIAAQLRAGDQLEPRKAFGEAQAAVTAKTKTGKLDSGQLSQVQQYELCDPTDPKLDVDATGHLPNGRRAAGIPRLISKDCDQFTNDEVGRVLQATRDERLAAPTGPAPSSCGDPRSNERFVELTQLTSENDVKQNIDLVIKRLKDQNVQVALQAVRTLDRLDNGTLIGRTTDIVKAVRTAEPVVRALARDLLGCKRRLLSMSIGDLLSFFRSDHPGLRGHAEQYLWRRDAVELKPFADEAFNLLESSDARVRRSALKKLSELGAGDLNGHDRVRALIKRLADEEVAVRREAVNALQKLDQDTLQQHGKALRTALRHDLEWDDGDTEAVKQILERVGGKAAGTSDSLIRKVGTVAATAVFIMILSAVVRRKRCR